MANGRNGIYYDWNFSSQKRIDYEIKSIEDDEIGIDTPIGVYIYFLKSEKDFDRAVSLDKVKENFEYYDCTPKGKIKSAKGTCIIKEGGLYLGNSQFDRDALIRTKIVVYP